MSELKLYRKRLIPRECVLLKDDVILRQDDDIIVTSWNVLKPRKDFAYGYSCFYIKEHYRVSAFYRADRSFKYHYFDIGEYEYDAAAGSLTFTDLLADIVVFPDGEVRVLDLDEVADMLASGHLSPEKCSLCLNTLHTLISRLYSEGIHEIAAPLRAIAGEQLCARAV